MSHNSIFSAKNILLIVTGVILSVIILTTFPSSEQYPDLELPDLTFDSHAQQDMHVEVFTSAQQALSLLTTTVDPNLTNLMDWREGFTGSGILVSEIMPTIVKMSKYKGNQMDDLFEGVEVEMLPKLQKQLRSAAKQAKRNPDAVGNSCEICMGIIAKVFEKAATDADIPVLLNEAANTAQRVWKSLGGHQIQKREDGAQFKGKHGSNRTGRGAKQ